MKILTTRYSNWLMNQGLSPFTQRHYITALIQIPEDYESFFASNPKNRTNCIKAFRSYTKFRYSIKEINLEEYTQIMNEYRTRRKRNHQPKRIAVPKPQWNEYIKKVPTIIGKFAVYLGFNFGLRLGELIHLRLQDIDLDNSILHVKNQSDWSPKYNRERSLPISNYHTSTIQRFLIEVRTPANPEHEYLLFSKHTKKLLPPRTIHEWCRRIGLRPHDLRYSFAVYMYELSDKNIKYVQLLLGHSNASTTSDYLALDTNSVLDEMKELLNQA